MTAAMPAAPVDADARDVAAAGSAELLRLAVASSGALRVGAALMVAGPLVAVAGGRWGTYIGVPGAPVFLTDALVVVGLLIIGLDRARNSAELRLPRTPVPVAAGAVLMAVVGVLGLVRGGAPDLFAIRDALPFVYLALTPVFVLAVRVVGVARVLRGLMVASVIHTFWYAAVEFGVVREFALPIVGVPVFTSRGDFDGLVGGIAIATVTVLSRAPIPWRLLVVAAAVSAQLVQGSRAGLVAMLIVAGAVAIASRPFRDERLGPVRLAAVFAALPVLAAGIIVAAQSSGWARALERLFAGSIESGSSNTTSARIDAWDRIITYVGHDAPARWFGKGFGSSFIVDSGAVEYLSGSSSVRQAHSFLVGWYALVGGIGLTLALIAFALFLLPPVRRMRRDPGARFGAAIQMGVLFAAAVGVIMESPFGYLLFVLAVGLSYAEAPDSRLPVPPVGAGVAGPVPLAPSVRGPASQFPVSTGAPARSGATAPDARTTEGGAT
ncbi:O-antigen ligase family protein [Demequina sp.]|uniref:O-antigen ligase family protein n=1 Tax=Demequina sp. TaxID=2050685 RepID=UPI0025F3D6D9|nr:O-antigen ligase family protein [Demequina sp.]